MLPNFLCIGAQKCGTTTIWHLLNAHSDICMAQPRETRFFYDDIQFGQGAQSYEIDHFSHWCDQSAVGEKCPEYLYVEGVAERIHTVLGRATKFIVTLRSPAQRAFSHYRHNLTMLRESRSFDEALAAEGELKRPGATTGVHFDYLGRGFYARQLLNYFRIFDKDRFLLINFEGEVASDQRALADKIFDFLEVSRHYPDGLPFNAGHPKLENLTVQIRTGNGDACGRFIEISRNRLGLGNLLDGGNVSVSQNRRNAVRRIYQPSPALLQFARAFIENKAAATRLPREREVEINRAYFREDVERLQSLVPFDVNRWLEL